MPLIFLPTLPQSCHSLNTEKKEKPSQGPYIFSEFPSILSTCLSFKELKDSDRVLIQSLLNEIANNTKHPIDVERIRARYNEILTNPLILEALLSIVVEAHTQTTQTAQNLKEYKKEAGKVKCLIESRKRAYFLTDIIDILGENNFYHKPELAMIRHDFLICLCLDIDHILSNISTGLYTDFFSQEYHEALTDAFEMASLLTETVCINVIRELEKSPLLSDKKALFEILKLAIHFPLYSATFYFANGEDKMALNSLKEDYTLPHKKLFQHLESQGIPGANNTYENLHQNIVSNRQQLYTDSLLEQKRLYYIVFHASINIFLEPSGQVDTRGSDPKERLKTIVKPISQIKELNAESMPLITKAIELIHFCHARHYDMDLDNLSKCKQLMMHLDRLSKNPKNIIVSSIQKIMKIQSESMANSKEAITQCNKEKEGYLEQKKPAKSDESSKSDSTKITKIQNQLKAAKEHASYQDKEIQRLKNEVERLHLTSALSDTQKTEQDKEIQTSNEKNLFLTQALDSLQTKYKTLKTTHKASQRHEEALEQRVEILTQKEFALQQAFESLKRNHDTLKTHYEEPQNSHSNSNQDKIDKLAQENNQLKDFIIQLDDILNTCYEKIAKLKKEKAFYRRRRNHHKSNSQQFQALQKETQSKLDTLAQQSQAKIAQLTEGILSTQKRIDHIDLPYRKAQQDIVTLKGQLAKLEAQLHTQNQSLAFRAQAYWPPAPLGYTPPPAANYYRPTPYTPAANHYRQMSYAPMPLKLPRPEPSSIVIQEITTESPPPTPTAKTA